MAGNIKEELLESFKHGTTLTKLIYINLGVFVVVSIVSVILKLFNIEQGWLGYLMLSSSPQEFIREPWSIITYMFLHKDFIHILFNILTLYWMGKLFLCEATQHSLVGLYILGGILGGIFYMLGINLFPYFANQEHVSSLLGASGSVMAITVATAVFSPEKPVRLVLIGEVKLKWIAIAFVLISFMQMASINAGGQMAHVGGAFAGYIFAKLYMSGKDITAWIDKIINGTVNFFRKFGKQPKMKASYKRTESDHDYNYRKKQENEEIDKILDKIKSSGYESLNDDEKRQLFGNKK